MKFIDILKEMTQFNNWVIPSLTQLKLEFKVEHELKNYKYWNNESEFIDAVKNGEIVSITSSQDDNIYNRSQTETYDELIDLISSYGSYPEFRNEKTVKDIYEGFKNNKPMNLPIIIELKNGKRRIMSGNTRMDIAFQLGITPKVIIIKSNNG
jgi:hypothetical protein